MFFVLVLGKVLYFLSQRQLLGLFFVLGNFQEMNNLELR